MGHRADVRVSYKAHRLAFLVRPGSDRSESDVVGSKIEKQIHSVHSQTVYNRAYMGQKRKPRTENAQRVHSQTVNIQGAHETSTRAHTHRHRHRKETETDPRAARYVGAYNSQTFYIYIYIYIHIQRLYTRETREPSTHTQQN